MITTQKIPGNTQVAIAFKEEEDKNFTPVPFYVNNKIIPEAVDTVRCNKLKYLSDKTFLKDGSNRYSIDSKYIQIVKQAIKIGYLQTNNATCVDYYQRAMMDINKKLATTYILPPGLKFYPAMSLDPDQRFFGYVSAESGAGKTTLASLWAMIHKYTWPDRKVYLISAKPKDPKFDDLGFVIRIAEGKELDEFMGKVTYKYIKKNNKKRRIDEPDIESEEEEEEEEEEEQEEDDSSKKSDEQKNKPKAKTLDDFANALYIFDDIEHISNANVYRFKDWLIMKGRSYKINIIHCNHIQRNSKNTQLDLYEFTHAGIFPQTMVGHHMKTFLKQYCGLSDRVGTEIKNMNSEHWVVIVKKFPVTIYNENQMFVVGQRDDLID